MTPGWRRRALTAAAAVASVLLIAAVPLLRQGPRYSFVTSSAIHGYDAAKGLKLVRTEALAKRTKVPAKRAA